MLEAFNKTCFVFLYLNYTLLFVLPIPVHDEGQFWRAFLNTLIRKFMFKSGFKDGFLNHPPSLGDWFST